MSGVYFYTYVYILFPACSGCTVLRRRQVPRKHNIIMMYDRCVHDKKRRKKK